MQVSLFVPTQSAAIDQQRNTISLFHIIEELSSPSFPLAIPSFTIAALLQRTVNEPNAPAGVAFVLTFEGRELLRHPTPINFQERLRLRVLLEVGGIAIEGPGNLIASLHSGEAQLASWPIVVRSIAQPNAQAELGI